MAASIAWLPVSAAGWYPDPSGVPGQYRYWDGQSWTQQVTTQLTPQPGGPGSGQASPYGLGGVSGPTGRKAGTGRKWLIALIAVAVALIVIVVLTVRALAGIGSGVPGIPGGQPSENVCPTPQADSSPVPQPNDGRVHSGPLSYPKLPAPWGEPTLADKDVPFGRDVQQQFVQTEQIPDMSWGAAVMVGELVAGDGFYAPKDGAEIVLRCVTGTFYGDAAVTRHDTKSQAMTVDGRDAWIMESDLSFSIPGLQATNELLTVVIIDLGNGTAGLFASSVPGNASQYNAPAQEALKGLRVS